MTDLFEEKAQDWDVNEMVLQLSSAIGKAILEHSPVDEQMTVMDFGAGTGLISAQLAPRVKRIIAVDTSTAMLDKLAEKAHLQDKIETVCQDILQSPLDRKVDLIVSAMAMHHVEDTDRLIETFAHHLKPGGRLALADLDSEDGSFHPPEAQGVYHQGFDRKALQALLEKHGFTHIRFHTAHTVDKEGKAYTVFLVTAESTNDA